MANEKSFVNQLFEGVLTGVLVVGAVAVAAAEAENQKQLKIKELRGELEKLEGKKDIQVIVTDRETAVYQEHKTNFSRIVELQTKIAKTFSSYDKRPLEAELEALKGRQEFLEKLMK